MKNVYKNNDCDLSIIKHLNIGVIGYGIQGRAQALNLRDSGANVIIGNIHDKYRQIAKDDGFNPLDISEAVSESDIILFLIPDESHKMIYDNYVKSNISPSKLIIFAHGYSLRYKKIQISNEIDIGLLAPRFPGKPIREQYLAGKGVPAFIDVINDHSGKTLDKILAVGSYLGFGRVGMIPVSYREETELDLFIEHFIGPLFISSIEKSLEFLIKKGYNDIPSALELYLSGERGSMWTAYARDGLFNALKNNASPTCQFGIKSYFDETFNEKLEIQMEKVIEAIRDGSFAENLKAEEAIKYNNVNKFFNEKRNGSLASVEKKVKTLLNNYL